ncbi:unnamed protein product [Taenia asiatica]|uniref:CX domain-containing protein n=1 Tax=Taenia asiatica TaxID=60517 RepID=A0A158R7W1_TAEAS|nr:unnamed protein product [Taenia asiatica]
MRKWVHHACAHTYAHDHTGGLAFCRFAPSRLSSRSVGVIASSTFSGCGLSEILQPVSKWSLLCGLSFYSPLLSLLAHMGRDARSKAQSREGEENGGEVTTCFLDSNRYISRGLLIYGPTAYRAVDTLPRDYGQVEGEDLHKRYILCKCDTAECRAAKMSECTAEFYCYVSFRLAKLSERKTSATLKMYGAGSQLFVAEHRGCVPPDQLEMCQEHAAAGGDGGSSVVSGGFGNLNVDEEGRARPPVVRCCRDNWCNIGQELEFTRAELEGRQFFLNPEISELEPGPDFSPFSSKSAKGAFHPHLFMDSQNAANEPHKKRKNTGVGVAATLAASSTQEQRKRPSYANDGPFNQWLGRASTSSASSPPLHQPLSLPSPSGLGPYAKGRDSVSKNDETYLSPLRVEPRHPQDGDAEATREGEPRPAVVLQPLHIAIGVCLIILMAVGVLLHVVIVLHRRHRRLKRELMRQTQKTTLTASQQQQQQPHHRPFIAANATADQPDGQQIHLQQLKYSTPSPEQLCQYTSDKRKRRSCCFLRVWKRPQGKMLPSNFYDETPTHQIANMTSEVQFKQYMPHEPQTSSQSMVTYHGVPATTSPLCNPAPTPPTLPNSSILNQQQQHQQLSPLQQVMYSPHSSDHALHPNINKNAYATGSSVSGGSGNNPSTAESSLPTQSSAVNGWNNTNNNVFLLNGFTPTMHTTNLERQNLSDSSEVGALVTPDFETRRANVALPPALLGGEGVGPPLPSPPINSTSLALFRSAAPQNEACTLVTPYAQLQLSLTFDQYDTPERIFGDGNTSTAGSGSLDGVNGPRNQTSSNPTTNSSLLHSYCEHGGTGDLRV